MSTDLYFTFIHYPASTTFMTTKVQILIYLALTTKGMSYMFMVTKKITWLNTSTVPNDGQWQFPSGQPTIQLNN